MILSSHGIIGSSIVQFAFDADYQAVLDYGTTQGYTLPSASQQLLQNQLVVDLKDGGIWSKLDTFGVFATDGDSDFGLIDWIRLIDYTAVNSPTFTTDLGFQGDGISAYIDLVYQSQTDWVNVTQNNATQFVLNFNNPFPSNGIITGTNNGSYIFINPRNVSNNRTLRLHSATNSNPYSIGNEIGLHCTTREMSNTLNYYYNGSFVSSATMADVFQATDYYLFRNGPITNDTSASIYGYGGGMDSTEISDLNNAINTYITAI